MERRLVLRGVLAGAVGGLLAFVFARIFAEPQIQRAIDYESAREAAEDALNRSAGAAVGSAGAEPFSRLVQGNVGLAVALVAFGVAMGGLFAVAYALCLGRTGRLRARPLAVLLAGAAFVSTVLVPFVRYPVNPPAIGHEETIRQRSALYLVLVVSAVALAVLAVWCGRRLRPRLGPWNATVAAGAGYLAATGAVMLLLPSYGDLAANAPYHQATETPGPLTDGAGQIVFPGFPADVLFDFRLASIATQLVMWAAIGLVFAVLAERLLEPADSRPATGSAEILAGR